jgi:hypothetical protein
VCCEGLRSLLRRAVEASIYVVRAFVKLREMMDVEEKPNRILR